MIINSEKPYLKEISSLNVDEIIEALEKDGAIYFPNFFSSETVENRCLSR